MCLINKKNLSLLSDIRRIHSGIRRKILLTKALCFACHWRCESFQIRTRVMHSGFAYVIGVNRYHYILVLRYLSQPPMTDVIKIAVRAFFLQLIKNIKNWRNM